MTNSSAEELNTLKDLERPKRTVIKRSIAKYLKQ
jgi:hypothetical protein